MGGRGWVVGGIFRQAPGNSGITRDSSRSPINLISRLCSRGLLRSSDYREPSTFFVAACQRDDGLCAWPRDLTRSGSYTKLQK